MSKSMMAVTAMLAFSATGLTGAESSAPAGEAPPTAAAAPGGSQDPLELQHARASWLKSRTERTYYAPQFDLSGLPDYQPGKPLTGTIRQWGSNYLADSMLAKYLEGGFRHYQPGVKFEDNLSSTFIGMASLYMGRADLAAMGRRATWDELQAFQRVLDSPPVEIAMATGSLDVAGWTFALVVMVNRDNPLAHLTLAQLDGIFGAERDGGWKGNQWDPGAARGPEKNLRTWGQLGLTGEWANQPIHVYGYNLNYHFPRDFAEKVMGGGYKWNEGMHEFSNGAKADGSNLISAGDLLVKAVGDDRYGITYTCIRYRTPQVKTLEIAGGPAGPFVAPTLVTVQNRTYPLAREVYYYTIRAPGKPIDPLVQEFLRFVLSRQGQEAVQRDGKYLPMTAEMVKEQRRKLDGVGQSGGRPGDS
jgi:phosphate transport system substrate-binding protein